jgi:hypothetical protein
MVVGFTAMIVCLTFLLAYEDRDKKLETAIIDLEGDGPVVVAMVVDPGLELFTKRLRNVDDFFPSIKLIDYMLDACLR